MEVIVKVDRVRTHKGTWLYCTCLGDLEKTCESCDYVDYYHTHTDGLYEEAYDHHEDD